MAAFIAALPAFIMALPDMMAIGAKMMTLVMRFMDWVDKNGVEKWMEEVEGAINALEGAKTSDEKLKAARGLSDVFRKLG